MKVSVVVNTYSEDRYNDFSEAVEAVLNQTYDPLELVLVVDGNQQLHERVVADYGNTDRIVTVCTDENRGNSGARNAGAEVASGDVIAVTDDDAVPEPDWIEEIVSTYEQTDAIAVGGPVVAEWINGKPTYFPDEFLWLVGCNQPGFGEHLEEVRNTYGCNISFRREVFEELGGFSEHVGRVADRPIQGHESEICIRMRKEFGRGVVYNTNAVVHHKVYQYRTELSWLVERCFWQGVSKRIMEQLVGDATDEEMTFLKLLMTTYTPNRLRSLVSDPSLAGLTQLAALYIFTVIVGIGYLYGILKGDWIGDE